jgi:hypothetical protein
VLGEELDVAARQLFGDGHLGGVQCRGDLVYRLAGSKKYTVFPSPYSAFQEGNGYGLLFIISIMKTTDMIAAPEYRRKAPF